MFAKKLLSVSVILLFLVSVFLIAEDKPAEPKAKEEKKEGEKVQCSEMTKAGTRCKRMTKDASGKCWQHGGKKDETAEAEEKEEAKATDTKKEEPKKEEAKTPEVKKEEPKKEESKTTEVKKEEEEKEVGSTQCTEKTAAGERCKKKTKSPNGKCKQHGGN